jgi:hypothetical protein
MGSRQKGRNPASTTAKFHSCALPSASVHTNIPHDSNVVVAGYASRSGMVFQVLRIVPIAIRLCEHQIHMSKRSIRSCRDLRRQLSQCGLISPGPVRISQIPNGQLVCASRTSGQISYSATLVGIITRRRCTSPKRERDRSRCARFACTRVLLLSYCTRNTTVWNHAFCVSISNCI